ncbi:MAG: 50S ribosome-binding GTPase [Candidatus Lokiarchaeota archaeon]|nr:50S ribosome-binding GTPase [Candidatus Lokiarchaeota archaeon]
MIINKILLLGKEGVGKTSLKKIIFENSNPDLLLRNSLEPTRTLEIFNCDWCDVNLNIFDIPGQEIKNFLEEGENQDFVFENVDIVIYIFDHRSLREQSQEIVDDIETIDNIIKKKKKSSRLVLIYHKIDLIPELFQKNPKLLINQIQNLMNLKIKPDMYFTSIDKKFIYSIHNTFSEILSSFSNKVAKIKNILDLHIKNYHNILCLITNNQNKVVTLSKSEEYNINLIYDSFLIFYELWEQNRLSSYLDNESHLFKSNDKVRIVKIHKLNFLKSDLSYLIVISESFNEVKLDELIHSIIEDLINSFKKNNLMHE